MALCGDLFYKASIAIPCIEGFDATLRGIHTRMRQAAILLDLTAMASSHNSCRRGSLDQMPGEADRWLAVLVRVSHLVLRAVQCGDLPTQSSAATSRRASYGVESSAP